LNSNKEFELFKTEKKLESLSLGLEDKIILHELDLVKFLPEKYVLNPLFSDKLYQKIQSGSKTMTESDLNQILAEQKSIGNLAEKLTLDYEKTYFKQNKWKYQQNNVKIISKDHVNAGYDVESFLSKNSKLDLSGIGDKHIEVKGRKYNDFSFIISANELKTAEKISKHSNEKYLIYFWNNLGAKKLPTKPIKILNFNELNITPCDNCLNYFVNI